MADLWHCTTDHVTEPCGDCDGCRYDQQLERSVVTAADLLYQSDGPPEDDDLLGSDEKVAGRAER